jgi:hypothetical protein
MPNGNDLRSCSCSNPRPAVVIGGDEDITLELLDQHMVFQILPAEVEEGVDFMARERFDKPRINTRVYNDAHAS